MTIFPSEDAIPTAPDAILPDADPPDEELDSEEIEARVDREKREEDLAP
jgi:hypothetical protein